MSNEEIICKEFPEYKIYYKRYGYGLIVHRDNGPAIEGYTGRKEWWINGKCHRKDGPAIEFADGSKEWWINGKRHREDGPAVEWVNGHKEYWLNDSFYREEEYWSIVKLGAFV